MLAVCGVLRVLARWYDGLLERLQPKLPVGKEDNKGLRIWQITKSRVAILVLRVDVTFELACRFK